MANVEQEILTTTQLAEGKKALVQFENFQSGIVVTTPRLSKLLAQKTLLSSQEKMGVELFLSDVDFKNPDSVKSFLSFWNEKPNGDLLRQLSYGSIYPNKLLKLGFNKYPIFLFQNPISLTEFGADDFKQMAKSPDTLNTLRKIRKFGKVHVAISPAVLEHPGTANMHILNAYKRAVATPDVSQNKEMISKYLYSQSIIMQLGLQPRVADPGSILTPASECLERLI